MKQMKSYRLKASTILQLDEMTKRYQCTETELIEKGVDILEIIMLLESRYVNPIYYAKSISGKKFRIEMVDDKIV